jgi:putative transcriptional regulator
MPIKINLDRIMFAQRVSLTDLATRVDLTLANLSILKSNKARAIRFSTLEALCRELNCQPGDLIEYVPEMISNSKTDSGPRLQFQLHSTDP